MTDRGLPFVDGAPACPFVAFDDDRDARASSPDHRHRCYAEIRPAPRALAHQEAYCLSSSFPICPTFQDWARREAAKATAAAAAIPPAIVPGANLGPGATDRSISQPPAPEQPQRNPPRDWSAPPPWLGADDDPDADEREAAPQSRGGGLSGSFADRLASVPAPESSPGDPGPVPAAPAWRDSGLGSVTEPTSVPLALGDDPVEDDEADDNGDRRPRGEDSRRRTAGARPRERQRAVDQAGPVWERPRRREAYPTIRTRMGLAGVTLPSVLIGGVAVVIAAVALFFLPAFLGLGNPQATGSPSGSPGSSLAAASPTTGLPTEVPVPTQQTYVVQAGDTMSKIATRFGVPLQTLVDANKAAIPNPNLIKIGDVVIIPAVTPTSLPGAGPSASP